MYDSNSRGISYTAGFFILIAFVVAGVILAGLLSIPVWTSMTGTGFEKMTTELGNPAYSDALRVIQAITAIVGFFLPAWLVAVLLNKKPMKLIGFTGWPTGIQILIMFLIAFFGIMVSSGFAYFNSHLPVPAGWEASFNKMEDDYNSGVESIIDLSSFTGYLVALLILAVLPAICEEVLFRGGFQNFLTRSTNKPWFSIIIVSIIFSLAHWSYYGFLSRLFLGIMLGLLYHYSGKIWLNILGHFLNNGIAITVIYIYVLNGKSLKDAINDDSDSYWGIFALPIVILLFIWLRNVSRRYKKVPEPFPPTPPPPEISGDQFS